MKRHKNTKKYTFSLIELIRNLQRVCGVEGKICILTQHNTYIYIIQHQGQCILFSVVFTPSPPSHHGSVWVKPIISLLLNNTVSPVQAYPNGGRGFVGPKKKTVVGFLVFNPLYIALDPPHCFLSLLAYKNMVVSIP